MKILKVKCLAPTRLDNYLMQQFPALNPGRLNKALRENKIKLNGKKQPLSTRVMAGDEIKLFILDDVLDADKRVDGPAWKNARGPAQVVYDCPQILIVNKPAFGSYMLPSEILDELMAHNKAVDDIEKIVIYGYCTDICVISNAMVLRAAFPETEIEILSDCCAGVTPQSHQTALDAMRACQFTIV